MRKRTARILTGIAIVVIALGVLYGIAVAISAFKLHQAYAALQKDGRPMRIADIAPAKIPDSENAALLYESAALLLRAQPAPKHDLLEYLGKLSNEYIRGTAEPNKVAETERLVRSDVAARALTTVEEGAERPSCRFDCDYEAGLAMRLPSMVDAHNLAWILGVKACVEGSEGHGDRAWRAIQAQLKLASAWRTQPPLILGQYARFGLVEIACTTIQRLCHDAPPTAQQVRDIEPLLKECYDIQPFVLTVDGERLINGESIFRLPRKELYKLLVDAHSDDRLFKIFQPVRLRLATFKPLFLADHAVYLRLSLEYVHLVQDANALDKSREMENKFFATQKGHVLSSTFAVVWGSPIAEYYAMVARARIASIGLALLQYRQAHGSFPESLDAPGVQSIEDPFSKKPLIYHREGSGFVLYSIGKDRKDNGGTPRQPEQIRDYDIVWRFSGQSAKQ